MLTYMQFPVEHWRKIHSTNPLERLNREIARRVEVVGIFPNPQAALRLIGAVLQEQQDEWMVGTPLLQHEVHGEAGRLREACWNDP